MGFHGKVTDKQDIRYYAQQKYTLVIDKMIVATQLHDQPEDRNQQDKRYYRGNHRNCDSGKICVGSQYISEVHAVAN